MRKELAEIIRGLSSRSLPEIGLSLTALEAYLASLSPSLEQFSKTNTLDLRLNALIALQDSFQYNVVSLLLEALAYLGQSASPGETSQLLLLNHCMCGMLLIHSDSRKLFERRTNMDLVLSLLDKLHPFCTPKVCISVLSLLVHVLVKSSANLRVFEAAEGCKIVSQHLHVINASAGETEPGTEDLSLKVVEFFIFYLTDESGLEGQTRSIKYKADILRPHFAGIDELLRNLEEITTLKAPAAHHLMNGP